MRIANNREAIETTSAMALRIEPEPGGCLPDEHSRMCASSSIFSHRLEETITSEQFIGSVSIMVAASLWMKAMTPFAGRDDTDEGDGLVLMLFIVRNCGWPIQGANDHVERLRRTPFQNVERKAQQMKSISQTVNDAWRDFLATNNADKTPSRSALRLPTSVKRTT